MATRKALVLGAGNLPQELQAGDTIAGVEPAFSKGSLIQGSGVTLTGTLTDRLVGSGDVTIAASGGGGGGNIPIDVKSANYTFVAGDKGRNIVKTSNNAYTFTINNSVFSAGDWFMVSNFATNLNITIARGSGVTLYYAGSNMDTNKVVVPRGMCTVYMESASVGYVFGTGVG